MTKLPTILCIDSDADSCEIMEILMSRVGFEVVTKQSGRDALDHARNNSFSVIISEYLLSDIDALQLCMQIKEIHPDVPIVFYSLESRNEHRQRGLSAGAKAFLVKPNDLERIEKTVLDLALV